MNTMILTGETAETLAMRKAAFQRGIRDASYDTMRQGRIPSYNGDAVVEDAQGQLWHVSCVSPKGNAHFCTKGGQLVAERLPVELLPEIETELRWVPQTGERLRKIGIVANFLTTAWNYNEDLSVLIASAYINQDFAESWEGLDEAAIRLREEMPEVRRPEPKFWARRRAEAAGK